MTTTQQIREFIEADPHASIREVATALGVTVDKVRSVRRRYGIYYPGSLRARQDQQERQAYILGASVVSLAGKKALQIVLSHFGRVRIGGLKRHQWGPFCRECAAIVDIYAKRRAA